MDKVEALRIAATDANVSDKIRALDAAGYPRAEIAKLLGKRYQHVRNVLEGDKLRAAPGVAEPARRYSALPSPAERDVEERGGAYRLVVREDGSILLPSAVREAFGVTGRGVVMARLEGEELKVYSATTAMARAQKILEPYRWKGGPLASEELIAERRAEAARDADG